MRQVVIRAVERKCREEPHRRGAQSRKIGREMYFTLYSIFESARRFDDDRAYSLELPYLGRNRHRNATSFWLTLTLLISI